MTAHQHLVRLFRSPTFLIGLATFVLLTSLVAGAVRTARQAARTASCNCHLKQLGIALQNYHDTYKCYPPAYIADASGKPMHSWRVILLPYFGSEELQRTYDEYDFSEPWNGRHNRELTNRIPYFYRCPSSEAPAGDTSYVAVVGTDAGWPGAETICAPDVTDGTSNTIAIVEVADAGIHWMEPRDLTFEQASAGIGRSQVKEQISSPHTDGANCMFFDCSVHFLPKDLSPELVRGLLTRNGGENVEAAWQVIY